MHRGSRKHILDLVSAADFPAQLNRVLERRGVIVEARDHRPLDHGHPDETTLRPFLDGKRFDGFDYKAFSSWWVPEHFKNPTWDLLATCTIDGTPGILLVEAKAHETELDFNGKRMEKDTSTQGRDNHEVIRRCIAAASRELGEHIDSVNLTVESHYQLANRIASAWNLASSGMHAVLLYLGFTGDSYFDDGLRDGDHWQRVMGAYIANTVPLGLPNRRIHHPSGGSFQFFIESLPVLEVSSLNRSPSPVA